MHYQKIDFDSPWITKVYALRQLVLREPLGLNLFEEDLLGERDELFFIAHEEGDLVSCMQFVILNHQVLKLRQMATAPDYRGKGFGRQLVLFGEEWAKDNDYRTVELHARDHAVGFYHKLGYETTGNPFEEVGIPHVKMKKIIQ